MNHSSKKTKAEQDLEAELAKRNKLVEMRMHTKIPKEVKKIDNLIVSSGDKVDDLMEKVEANRTPTEQLQARTQLKSDQKMISDLLLP